MSETPTQQLTIQGITFQATLPYAAGHTLSENEAKVLNQTRVENLRNNFAKQVADAKEEAGEGAMSDEAIAALHEAFAKYDSEYMFSGTRQTRGPIDPVATRARKIAREMITEQARSKGMKVREWPEGQMDKFIDALLLKRPDITEEAKRQVETSKALASDVLGDLEVPASGDSQSAAA